MAEAPKPKYDSLPGIDTAPDVYETPELDNDSSTIQASTAVSESEGDDSEEDDSGVRHSRFQTDQARSRFQPSRVDARGVDFSDNISAQRRSYRTATQAQRRRGEILGDDSDEDEEPFTTKLMRVKRELHELEQEYEVRVASGDKSKVDEQDPREVMETISDKVDSIYAMRRGGIRGAEPILERTMQKFENYPAFGPSPHILQAIERRPPLPGSQIQKSQLDYVLTQAADFEARITDLEKSLGLSGNNMPDIAENAPFPVFTTLDRLDQMVSMVADASAGNLDTATQNVKKLMAEANEVEETQQESLRDAGRGGEAKPYAFRDQEAKVNALYGTLPAIDKLSPVLPLVLERLRTLRLVHTSAWQADEVLTELEQRQSKQEDEIKKWEESLQQAEHDVKECEKSLQQNMKTVGDWVKKLEQRMEKLPGAS